MSDQLKSEQGRAERDTPFPLEAYCQVYEWIGNWAEETDDPELLAIAQSACESLHAVGEVVLYTMR